MIFHFSSVIFDRENARRHRPTSIRGMYARIGLAMAWEEKLEDHVNERMRHVIWRRRGEETRWQDKSFFSSAPCLSLFLSFYALQLMGLNEKEDTVMFFSQSCSNCIVRVHSLRQTETRREEKRKKRWCWTNAINVSTLSLSLCVGRSFYSLCLNVIVYRRSSSLKR